MNDKELIAQLIIRVNKLEDVLGKAVIVIEKLSIRVIEISNHIEK